MTWLGLLLTLHLGVAAPAPPTKPLKLRLKAVSASKYDLRLGVDVKGELPRSFLLAKLKKQRWLLIDLDGDGAITPGGADGLALEGYRFVVALPKTLLLPAGQCAVSVEGKKLLRLEPQSLAVPDTSVRQAARMTEVRIRAGLAPLLLDEKACADCLLHLKYLSLNPLVSGVSSHDETPGKPGYTKDGARAGKGSNISPGSTDIDASIRRCSATAWHGVPMYDPGMRHFGVGSDSAGCMTYFLGRTYASQYAHPSEGATGIPLSFSPESPAPVTDQSSRGFPIFLKMRGPLANAEIEGVELVPLKKKKGKWKDGKPLEGFTSSPKSPATASWPSNSGAAVFIPAKALKKKTRYRVTFSFRGEAFPARTWTFTTK